MTTKNQYLVTKVSITETLRNIPIGKPITFDCREAGSFASAKGAISRLNERAKSEAYTITTKDNGATYTVLRKS